jgi:hypothetical protein
MCLTATVGDRPMRDRFQELSQGCRNMVQELRGGHLTRLALMTTRLATGGLELSEP